MGNMPEPTGFTMTMVDFSPKNLSPIGRVVAWLFLFGLLAVFYFTTPYMTVATFAYFCLILGLIERKKRNFHMSLMLTGIIADILIVLVLEGTRSAIGTAVGTPLTGLQYLHISVSLLAVLFYLPVLFLGYFLAGQVDDRAKLRSRHLKFGVTAFVLRSVGWISMFSFLGFSS